MFTAHNGMRIENLCEIVEKIPAADSATDHGPFYGFADLTMIPYARNLIDMNLLTEEEISWVNAYHQRVYDLLANDLPDAVRDWLASATAPLEKA